MHAHFEVVTKFEVSFALAVTQDIKITNQVCSFQLVV